MTDGTKKTADGGRRKPPPPVTREAEPEPREKRGRGLRKLSVTTRLRGWGRQER